MKHLEKKVKNDEPSTIQMVIYDGFYILHQFKNLPTSFGDISKTILKRITNTSASRVDIIFDTYKSPCIKD